MVKNISKLTGKKSYKGHTRRLVKGINKKDEATPLLRAKIVNLTFFSLVKITVCASKKIKL